MLKGRKVVLYPDLNGFQKWKAKLPELSKIGQFEISELLETKASQGDRQEGLDLADYLTRFSIQEFQEHAVRPEIVITDENIASIRCETKLGADFGNISIVWVQTAEEKAFDLLFKSNGEPVKYGELQNELSALADFFGKRILPVLFNNRLCWGSCDHMHPTFTGPSPTVTNGGEKPRAKATDRIF